MKHGVTFFHKTAYLLFFSNNWTLFKCQIPECTVECNLVFFPGESLGALGALGTVLTNVSEDRTACIFRVVGLEYWLRWFIFLRNSGTHTHRKAKMTNDHFRKHGLFSILAGASYCHLSPVSCLRVSSISKTSISMLPEMFIADHSEVIKLKIWLWSA